MCLTDPVVPPHAEKQPKARRPRPTSPRGVRHACRSKPDVDVRHRPGECVMRAAQSTTSTSDIAPGSASCVPLKARRPRPTSPRGVRHACRSKPDVHVRHRPGECVMRAAQSTTSTSDIAPGSASCVPLKARLRRPTSPRGVRHACRSKPDVDVRHRPRECVMRAAQSTTSTSDIAPGSASCVPLKARHKLIQESALENAARNMKRVHVLKSAQGRHVRQAEAPRRRATPGVVPGLSVAEFE